MNKFILNECGERVYAFMEQFVTFCDKRTCVVSTSTQFNIDNLSDDFFTTIINLRKINDIRRINKFLEAINGKLPLNGIFIGCAETKELRRKRLLKKYPMVLNYIFFFFNFIFKRVFPKLPFFKKIYFVITQGKGRVISKAEVLGRLYSCGFAVIEEKIVNNLLYFVVEKIKEPAYDMNPSYGPIFKMRRVGKNGKIIYVYKFRTMHPYAEYLQDYIVKKYGYSNIGKPKNDFRLTSWGKFLRKYWLDELPQLINVFKGEMRLVGVRPLSERFLKEYPEDIKKMRLKYKPGCIPPYVALLKQDVKEYIQADIKYLTEKEKHPFWTDIKFLTKAIFNIITNKIRSA